MVECLTRDRGAEGSSLTSVTALWFLSKTHYHSLVLVQPRKTRPCSTERFLMGRKESNQIKQTNPHSWYFEHVCIYCRKIYQVSSLNGYLKYVFNLWLQKRHHLSLNEPVTTKVVCFSRLLKCLSSLYGKQCGPRSDCF